MQGSENNGQKLLCLFVVRAEGLRKVAKEFGRDTSWGFNRVSTYRTRMHNNKDRTSSRYVKLFCFFILIVGSF